MTMQRPEVDGDPAPVRGPWALGSPRTILIGIFIIQSILSQLLRNSAHRDEALYMWAGHAELNEWLYGAAPVNEGFTSYFSGSPFLYPVYGAALDGVGGIYTARLLSLFFMLWATGLVYGTAKKMFSSPQVGLWAAGLFAVTQSTQMLGNFATFDAMAIGFLALSAWLAVRDYGWVIAGPIGMIAIGSKFAAALYIPTIAVLAGVMVWPNVKQAIIRLVTVGVSGIGLGVAFIVGTGSIDALLSTTANRAGGGTPSSVILKSSAEWTGAMMVLAIIGAVLYASTGERRVIKALTGVVIVGTGLLSPAYQLRLATDVSLNKHVGYGMVFVALLAGYALGQLNRAKIAGIVAGILVVTGTGYMAHTQASAVFQQWPNAEPLIAAVRPYVKPGTRNMTEVAEIVPYYLQDVIPPQDWDNLDYFNYKGKELPESYVLAIKDGYFDLIIKHAYAFDGPSGPMAQGTATIEKSKRYKMVVDQPHKTIYGENKYQVWIKVQ